jgi:hypothetical protein
LQNFELDEMKDCQGTNISLVLSWNSVSFTYSGISEENITTAGFCEVIISNTTSSTYGGSFQVLPGA